MSQKSEYNQIGNENTIKTKWEFLSTICNPPNHINGSFPFTFDRRQFPMTDTFIHDDHFFYSNEYIYIGILHPYSN